jgi:hypothetical protein
MSAEGGQGERLSASFTFHPDVTVAVSLLSKRNSCPTPASMKAVKHLVRYLAGRRRHGLAMGRGDGYGLIIWVDSDHAGTYAIDGETRSRMGVLATYNGCAIGWLSKYITGVMVSSGEAEVFALSEAIRWALHLKYVGEELGITMPDSVPIMVDATVAIAFAENWQGVGRMKHLDLRAAWIREMKSSVRDRKVRLVKVPGPENKADFFTKILPTAEHTSSVDDLTVVVTLQE